MLKIGDFSLLGRVSPKALRLYDELGLLKPERVDPATQYRYYAAPQLARLRAIRGLLALGFKLEEIGPVLAGELAGRGLAEEAGRKLAAAEAERAALEARVAALGRLREAALGGQPLAAALGGGEGRGPRWVEEPGRWIASIRTVVPEYSAAGSLVGALFGALAAGGPELAGAFPAGAPGCIYHDAEYRERDADVEVFVSVGFRGPPPSKSGAYPAVEGRVGLRYLDSAEGFMIEHRGPYESIGDAYSAIASVFDAAGISSTGAPREEWKVGPGNEKDPTRFISIIFIPSK